MRGGCRNIDGFGSLIVTLRGDCTNFRRCHLTETLSRGLKPGALPRLLLPSLHDDVSIFRIELDQPRAVRSAAMSVVPDPPNGSSTMSRLSHPHVLYMIKSKASPMATVTVSGAWNGHNTAPFADECQSFLDNVMASLGQIGVWSDPATSTPAISAPPGQRSHYIPRSRRFAVHPR